MPSVPCRDVPEGADAVLRRLKRARWRLEAQRAAERVAVVLLLWGGFEVVLAVVDLLGGTTLLHDYGWVMLLSSLFCVFALRPKGLTFADAARILDRRAGTRERCTTALALATQGEHSPVETLAWKDCAAAVLALPVRRWTPLTLPREARWLPVPLLALGMIHWHGTLANAVAPPDPALQAILRAQADELQRAADTRTGKKDAADRRLAEELARAAERLRQAAALRDPDPEAARRDALRELSDLQNRLRRLASARPSPAELAALAAALQREGSEAARAAEEALKRGDGGEAARHLEKLLEEMKKSADPAAALDRLARALRDQAGKLSEEERGELGRQMAQAQAEAQRREELLKKIADLLRQRGANGGGAGQPSANRGGQGEGQSGGQPGEGGGSSARGLTTQQLQSLLNSLENMKNGLNGSGGPGQGGMLLTLEDVPGRGEPPTAGEQAKPGGEGGPSGGAPGSDHDVGTSEIGRAPAPPPAPTERAARAPGLLGEGETLSDLAPSTDPAAPARAGRRYREVYEAMAPAARDSVRQENIPLGSRVLVERYFQNIRPPE